METQAGTSTATCESTPVQICREPTHQSQIQTVAISKASQIRKDVALHKSAAAGALKYQTPYHLFFGWRINACVATSGLRIVAPLRFLAFSIGFAISLFTGT
jgi:hypothetical protein